MLVSRGSLPIVTNGFVSFNVVNEEIEFQWDNNSGNGSAKVTDKALIAILNLTKGEAITETTGAVRPDCAHNIAVPAEWLGDKVHVYMGYISDDGKEVANSVYLGNINLA